MTTVSVERAVELRQTGEWIFDTEMLEQVSRLAQPVHVTPPTAEELGWQHEVYWRTTQDLTREVFNIIGRLAEERFNYFGVEDKAADESDAINLQFRIRPHTVLKVGPAIEQTLRGLGLVYALFFGTALALRVKLVLGSSLYDVIRKLLKTWEQIEDPDEQAVFETVFLLEGRRSGEILKIKDHTIASGPALFEASVEGIVHELGEGWDDQRLRCW
jgi:hypothetical protein